MNAPLVSIIIPTYNRAHLIGETLDSVIAQTYQNWECIVVDDGSTDHTEEVMADYMAKDARIRFYHRPENKLPGGNAARNYGFEKSKGEYIQWFDSDDLMSPKKIEIQLEQMITDNTMLSVCRWYLLRDNNQKRLQKKIVEENITSGLEIIEQFGVQKRYLLPIVYLVKRELIYQAGYWNDWLTVNQDGEFFARILVRADTISMIDDLECHALYRSQIVNNKRRIGSEKKAEDWIGSWRLVQAQLKLIDPIRYKEFIDHTESSIIKMLWDGYRSKIPRSKEFYLFALKKLKNKVKNKFSGRR